MTFILLVVALMVSAVTSFITPTPMSTSIISGGVLAESQPYTKISGSLSATVDADVVEVSDKSSFKFDNYNKPIVLLGLSSNGGNELQRLALSLSASLVGNNPQTMQSNLDKLQRSQGALLAGDVDDDDETKTSDQQTVAGISLSAVGLDEDGPFVLDAGLIGELIREKTL